jgi:hypothetical protein
MYTVRHAWYYIVCLGNMTQTVIGNSIGTLSTKRVTVSETVQKLSLCLFTSTIAVHHCRLPPRWGPTLAARAKVVVHPPEPLGPGFT